MIDINDPKGVQVQIRADGDTLWVNVDGKCALRIVGIPPGRIQVYDQRTDDALPED